MKRVVYTFIFSVLLYSCERAPGEFESSNFIKYFGNGYGSKGYDVIQLSDGNYVFTGYDYKTESDKQILLVKVDKYGDPVWNMNFGTADFNEEGKVVKEVSDGFIIAGTSRLFSNTQTDELFHSFILKTSPTGDSLWYKEFGDSAVNIVVNDFDIQGDYIYAVGESYQKSGAPDSYVAKLSAEGELIAVNGGSYPNSNSTLNKVFFQNDDIHSLGYFGLDDRMSLFIAGIEDLSGASYRFGLLGEAIADASLVNEASNSLLFILSNSQGSTKLSKYDINSIKIDAAARWVSEPFNSISGKALLSKDDGSFMVFGESGSGINTQINTIVINSDGTTNTAVDFRTIPGTISRVRQTMDGGAILIGSNATYGEVVQLIKTGKDLFILK